MVLYNTLMGVAAGLALILVPLLGRKLYRRERIAPEGWSLTFAVLGIILTFLGGLMTVTWPLTANPPINIIFAEPTLVLGLLLLAGAWYLWRQRLVVMALATGTKHEADEAQTTIARVLSPVSWLVLALGLMLLACTLAILRFGFVGGAPAEEPISGLLHDKPWIENTFFGVIYGLSALGALTMPFVVRRPASKLAWLIGISWTVAGVAFLLFSAMNYYTHVGLLVNLLEGKNFEF